MWSLEIIGWGKLVQINDAVIFYYVFKKWILWNDKKLLG